MCFAIRANGRSSQLSERANPVSKVYSSKSNAKRAAKEAGHSDATITQSGDGWTWQRPSAPAVQSVPSAVASGAADEEQILIAGFREFLGADDHSEGFIKELLRTAYRAGASSRQHRPRAAGTGGPTKREIAATLLCRSEGATAREILDATGWPAVSVPAIAKASNLEMRQEKDGRITRYFGYPA